MNSGDAKRLHSSLEFIGIRTQATAAGLLQLCRELAGAGVLDAGAVSRIRDTIVNDIALDCPRSMSRDQYQAMVRERLDSLLTDPVGKKPQGSAAQMLQ
ncbi:hypothetical protein GCM10023219_10020 [Stakelama sediminis]|uniref:Uncharacterized protein n=1 Tax=Stakelama sediminis TaxID=463200 RepID=A0A840YVY4_9SPHN|nr:hypothetical protein [Stakelama sediminis]